MTLIAQRVVTLLGALALVVVTTSRAQANDPPRDPGAAPVRAANPATIAANATGSSQPPLAAEPADAPASGAAAPAAQAPEDDPDFRPNRAQPDFTVINLPTTLRLPRHKGSFRVTHRFARPLGRGDFGDLASDLFGLDNGALIGLEFRFAPARGTQVGLHRAALGKTIELFGEYNLHQQDQRLPIGVNAFVSVEGVNNLRDQYSPTIAAIFSRELAQMGALYLEPVWVGNTNPLPSDLVDHNSTFLVGLGARIRLKPLLYFVGEFHPRVAGFKPGVNHGSVGIEKQVGGHVFQLNFSNSFATTMAQIARGGGELNEWHLGFNIARKFY